ncbi:glycine/betaine ABC transporter [Labilibaculum filiforme]|uniref:Glycine/betaine ABC transporter n=1 Tax=Labilibaculum filiforme TaxID=1940526 RepID=A0A2N3HVA0_9BACT|nr:glycine betaine ABC transporter substrate-binding protein [Labilibaculum filiforme]PKQ61984.1 glycine/betaine ABC transporter [Labilibaculum filiforme]
MNRKSNKIITLGVSDLSFHRVTASLLANVLTEMGFLVNRIYSSHPDNFEKLKSGAVDMLSSAWLPSSDGIYKAEVEEQVALIELGLHYEPYELWGVPDYVPLEDVEEISDLCKPNVRKKMRPAIQGIYSVAGITRSSLKIMDSYGLSQNGYRFFSGCEECCYSTFEQAVKNKEWMVLPLWKPQFLHHSHTIRELKDPKGILGTSDRAVALLRGDRKDLFTQKELERLGAMRFSNEIITNLDYQVFYNKIPLDELSGKFLANQI